MILKEKPKIKKAIKIAKTVKSPIVKAETKIKYFEGVGRRKTAIARVRLSPGGETKISVNGKDYKEYFLTAALQQMINTALDKIKYQGGLGAQVIVSGGGINSQAEAVRLGISRAFVKFVPDSYKKLRKLGYLTRDPRMRERKKPGLKRARKAPQWQKR